MTLALLRVEGERQAWELDELRAELVAHARQRQPDELASRDAYARADIAALQHADLPPAAPDLDVGLDLGP